MFDFVISDDSLLYFQDLPDVLSYIKSTELGTWKDSIWLSFRAATGVWWNIDHTLTEWPNINGFLFFLTVLASSIKFFANSIESSNLVILHSNLREILKVVDIVVDDIDPVAALL